MGPFHYNSFVTKLFKKKVHGIPFGKEVLQTNASKEDCEFIYGTIHMNSPWSKLENLTYLNDFSSKNNFII
jgi:hypothetical protein